MRTVKLAKQDLLSTAQTNRQKHITEYAEAVEDYKAAVLKICQDNLKLAKTADLDKFAKISSLPTAPRSYEAEYNRAIRMLEMSVEDVIEIEEDIFNQLVLDEWAWKTGFTVLNSSYKSLVSR